MFPLTFRHRAGVSPYTSPFGFAETYVFVKQSPGPFHCGLISEAPLFPKLRGHYAEFLNNPSPVGLRILSSSTCVGLRYGHLSIRQNFSRLVIRWLPYLFSVPFARVNQRPGPDSSKCPSGLSFGGYGISTVCASTTPLGLALAPGLPWADEPSPRNLRFSAIMIPT